jgi:hypothetical protein
LPAVDLHEAAVARMADLPQAADADRVAADLTQAVADMGPAGPEVGG